MNHHKGISKKVGLPPGSLVRVGKERSEPVTVSFISYNSTAVEETLIKDTTVKPKINTQNFVNWLHVNGTHDVDLVQRVGQWFDVHPLLIEDVLNSQHRPKAEEFDDYFFFTFKLLSVNAEENRVVSDQITCIMGKNWLVSFAEKQSPLFDSIIQRIKEGKGNLRTRGADYLFYRLVDTVVDQYFIVTDYFTEKLEDLEEEVLNNPEQKLLEEVQHMKKQLIKFRKHVFPVRDSTVFILKADSDLFSDKTSRYLQDVYEHLIHLGEAIESHRELLGSVMELYLTGISNRMNQIMKVLTIIATIFIPLTFIAGVYGMNFKVMPELDWKYGYAFTWGIMLLLALLLILYFRKKNWL